MKYLSIFAILMVALAFINAVNGFIVTPGMFKTKSKTLKSQPNTLGKTLYKDVTKNPFNHPMIGWLNGFLATILTMFMLFCKSDSGSKQTAFLNALKTTKIVIFCDFCETKQI